MGDFQMSPGPGKTAPRLIKDLLEYDPRYPVQSAGNLIAEHSPQYHGAAWPLIRRTERSCRHTLVKKATQSEVSVSDSDLPNETTNCKIMTYCIHCRYHFKIAVNLRRTKDTQVPCHLSDTENCLHHFRLIKSIDGKQYKQERGPNKYDLLTEAHHYQCTGPKCPAVLAIKVSPPRLSKQYLNLINDASVLRVRGETEIRKESERYVGQQPVTPIAAMGYLRTYLQDAERPITASGTRKKVAWRNKKYMLAFADQCHELFEYLDFKEIFETLSGDTEDSHFWELPRIDDKNRAFLEDVIFELTSIMEAKPRPQPGTLRPDNSTEKDIAKSLAYYGYPTRSRTSARYEEYDEHPHYLSLGAVDDFSDDLVLWAFDRQCRCDPSNKTYYLACLEAIGKGRDSADLQTKYALVASENEYLLKVEKAYQFFNLDPDTQEGDSHIMGLYRSRIQSAPRQKDDAREQLLVLGKARESNEIIALANDTTMTYEEAMEFLGVSSETESDMIEAAAIAKAEDLLITEKPRVARALRVIADQRRGDYTLERAAAQMDPDNVGGEYGLSSKEAYDRLQIRDPNVADETLFAYYQSLSGGAASGSKDSYTEALRTIARERHSVFLLQKLQDPNADVQVNTAEPVGLDNIGNTCYLNSLLQYYYTVKPVRDMVINFEDHRMPLTTENIMNKRVGGRIVAKSEIVKAQKFVAELHNLFENLKTASSRSVKPTKELAELTIFSSLTEANFRRASISSPAVSMNITSVMDIDRPVYGPEGPPAQAVSPASSGTIEDDIEMVDRPVEKQGEAADDSSETTLVEQDQPPSYVDSTTSTENGVFADQKRRHSDGDVAEDSVPGGSGVMVNGDALDKLQSGRNTAEEPPPIPPRNKSGLVISTTENKNMIPDDDLWRFGTQQDVTEVIGNVTFRMQCAIKATGVEEGFGEQIDVIRDTFFGSSTTYTQKARSLEKKVEAWPTIIVYPGKGVTRDIYEAIDVVFDEQKVEVDNTICPQYSCISKLPPVLQIQIQRTDYDKDTQRSSKNQTPVVFPETIYLDRYLDNADPNSTVMKRRRVTWKWKETLRGLETRKEALENKKAEINVPDALYATKDFIDLLQENDVEDIQIPAALPEALEGRISEVATELAEIANQIAEIKKSLQDQFTDMREHEYKLHSVFIHRGEAGGGHYWVYIYDFEHDIWREYNDEYVTEVKDTRRIFDPQSSAGGTPYYLVYVRSADKQQWVDAVCREVSDIQMVDLTNDDWLDQSQSDTVMMNGDYASGNDQVRHIEHANPRPLRPKPPNADTIAGSWDTNITDNAYDANGRPWNDG